MTLKMFLQGGVGANLQIVHLRKIIIFLWAYKPF